MIGEMEVEINPIQEKEIGEVIGIPTQMEVEDLIFL